MSSSSSSRATTLEQNISAILKQTKLPLHVSLQLASDNQIAINKMLAQGSLDIASLGELGDSLSKTLNGLRQRQLLEEINDPNREHLIKQKMTAFVMQYIKNNDDVKKIVEENYKYLSEQLQKEPSLYKISRPFAEKVLKSINDYSPTIKEVSRFDVIYPIEDIFKQNIQSLDKAIKTEHEAISDKISDLLENALGQLAQQAEQQGNAFEEIETELTSKMEAAVDPFCNSLFPIWKASHEELMRECVMLPRLAIETKLSNWHQSFSKAMFKEFDKKINKIFSAWKEDKTPEVIQVMENQLGLIKSQIELSFNLAFGAKTLEFMVQLSQPKEAEKNTKLFFDSLAEKNNAFLSRNGYHDAPMRIEENPGTESTPGSHYRIYNTDLLQKELLDFLKTNGIKHEEKSKNNKKFIVIRKDDIKSAGLTEAANLFINKFDEKMHSLEKTIDENTKLGKGLIAMFGADLGNSTHLYIGNKSYFNENSAVTISLATDNGKTTNRLEELCKLHDVKLQNFGVYSFAGEEDGHPRSHRADFSVDKDSFNKLIVILNTLKNELATENSLSPAHSEAVIQHASAETKIEPSNKYDIIRSFDSIGITIKAKSEEVGTYKQMLEAAQKSGLQLNNIEITPGAPRETTRENWIEAAKQIGMREIKFSGENEPATVPQRAASHR